MAKFLFIFFLSSGLFSSHLLGKNAADFHILTAICSFLSEAHQVLLTHRKHIEIDCVFLCVHACVCFFQHAFFFFFFLLSVLSSGFFPSLFFNRILLLSHAFLSVAIMTNYSVARGRIHYPFPFTSRTHIIWKLQGGGGLAVVHCHSRFLNFDYKNWLRTTKALHGLYSLMANSSWQSVVEFAVLKPWLRPTMLYPIN